MSRQSLTPSLLLIVGGLAAVLVGVGLVLVFRSAPVAPVAPVVEAPTPPPDRSTPVTPSPDRSTPVTPPRAQTRAVDPPPPASAASASAVATADPGNVPQAVPLPVGDDMSTLLARAEPGRSDDAAGPDPAAAMLAAAREAQSLAPADIEREMRAAAEAPAGGAAATQQDDPERVMRAAASQAPAPAVEIPLRPGEAVHDALLQAQDLAPEDREALHAIFADHGRAAAGLLRIEFAGRLVREAVLERGQLPPVRVLRTPQGTLARAP